MTAVYETASPEDFTQWIRDVAPPIVKLLEGQPTEVQDRVWRKVNEAWEPFMNAAGHVRTENQAVWLVATR